MQLSNTVFHYLKSPLWLACALALSLAANAQAMSRKPKPAEPTPCARLADKEWNRILDLVQTDVTNISRWRELEARVESIRAACAPAVAREPRLAGCLDNLETFVANQRLTREPGHSMGFRLSNAEYLSRQPKEMITFPDELANGLPKNWRDLCRTKEWDCVDFVSKSLPNPPFLSFKRVLIRAPGETFDRWMLFTIPRKGTTEHLVDFMGVEKARKDEATGALVNLEHPKLHFVEYWRNVFGEKPVYRKQIAACYRCHPSGMRDIVPSYGSTDAAGLATIKKLNQYMKENRPFDWGEGSIIQAAYGPPMGAKQTCTDCHDGSFRGVLNSAHLGERSRHQLFFKMTQDLTMPPGKAKDPEYQPLFDTLAKAWQLSPEDRDRLYTPNAIVPLFDMIGLAVGGDKGPMSVANRKLIKFLHRRGLVTEREQDEAITILGRIEDTMKQEFTDMKSQYRDELRSWLRGDRAECGALF